MAKEHDTGAWFKKHKFLTAFLIIIALVIFANAFASAPKDNNSVTEVNSSEQPTENTPTEQSIPKIGQAVRDGKFEFVVKSVECGKASVGTNEFLTKTAQGQYCMLNLSVKNIGNEAQSLFSDNQYLFNSTGQKYSADSTATMYAAPDSSSTWYSEINPGNSVEGTIVFDIPKDQTPLSSELHDSAFSGGVTVSLQ